MQPVATLTSLKEILPLRERCRQEMSCQITHDSMHYREGWTWPYQLQLSEAAVGYGRVAIAGP